MKGHQEGPVGGKCPVPWPWDGGGDVRNEVLARAVEVKPGRKQTGGGLCQCRHPAYDMVP